MTENELLIRLRQAVKDRIALSGLDAYIGTPATIKSVRAEDRETALHTDYGPDPDHANEFYPFTRGSFFAYWVFNQPEVSRVIGICLGQNVETPVIFRAVVYPA